MEGHVTEVHKPLASASEIGKSARSSARRLERSFPDTAELQKVYDESIIDCASLMVVMTSTSVSRGKMGDNNYWKT